MTIGLLQIDFLIPGARSLKDKRRVLKSLKQVMHNRFNCSVAEVEFKEKWGRARLAVCVVSDDSRFVNEQLNEIARFASMRGDAELLDYSIEMM
ncbi:MAG: uncharacterized protein QG656_2509 [Candidatus Hydrogenedentes bacterium]|nr:uncharacterized protein [Candidatus Hydrogenedentota bacterium]